MEDKAKAIEDGELKATEVVAELVVDNTKAKVAKNQNPQAEDIGAEKVAGTSKEQLSEEVQDGIEKAEVTEATRLASEKAQDKVDDLSTKIADLTEVADKDKADAKRNAKVLDSAKKAKAAADLNLVAAKENGADAETVSKSQDAVDTLAKVVEKAELAFNESLQACAEEINKLTDEYNKTLEVIKVAKKSESDNGEPAVEPEKPEGVVTETGEPAINEVTAYGETGAPAVNNVPDYKLTTAGTKQDQTYQAPAAKAEDKKELPNTGGKDNVAVASLGFLGLFLGALPFVKRKN